MKLIDTHCHLTDSRYNDNLDIVLKNIREKLDFVINVGYDLKTSENSVKLSNEYEYIYATVGVHPNDSDSYNILVEEKLEELVKNNNKIVAIGEIGLDYYRDYVSKEIQQDVFIKQLKLAKKLDKPVVIHCRDAYKDTIDILNEYKDVNGIMHSYSGSYDTAKLLMDRFYFSISGPVTFSNAINLHDMVEKLPIDKILVETDSPYLTPVPYRGKTNEPSYVEYIAKKIASIKNIEYEELKKILSKNTKKAFRIE